MVDRETHLGIRTRRLSYPRGAAAVAYTRSDAKTHSALVQDLKCRSVDIDGRNPLARPGQTRRGHFAVSCPGNFSVFGRTLDGDFNIDANGPLVYELSAEIAGHCNQR